MPASMLRLFTGWYVSKSDEPHDSRPGDLIFGNKGGPGKNGRGCGRISAQAAMPSRAARPRLCPAPLLDQLPRQVEPLTTKLRPPRSRPNQGRHCQGHAGRDDPVPYNPDIGGKYAWTTLPSLQRMQDADPEVELWPPYSDLDMAILLHRGTRTSTDWRPRSRHRSRCGSGSSTPIRLPVFRPCPPPKKTPQPRSRGVSRPRPNRPGQFERVSPCSGFPVPISDAQKLPPRF